MRHITLLVLFVAFASMSALAQVIDYSIDANSIECAGGYEGSPGQGGESGCQAWSNGELIYGRWWGSAEMTIYGTCNTSFQEVNVDNGVAFFNCADPHGVNLNGTAGYTTTLQDQYLVYTGYVTVFGGIWDNNGIQTYESHSRSYCDSPPIVVVHTPYPSC